MHRRNPYRDNAPDFISLKDKYPILKRHFKSKADGKSLYYNFQDPQAIVDLTESLLDNDFSLKVRLPIENLCPRVANRLNYILWIEDVLNSTQGHDPLTSISGLDIGCGPSCIYPLLACRQNPHWTFLATDINLTSLQVARENVLANKLEDRIHIIEKTAEDALFLFDNEVNSTATLDFTMCNPPFYESSEEIMTLESFKQRSPLSKLNAHYDELVTPGGEVQFIKKMFKDSYDFYKSGGNKKIWFTTMVGKLNSLVDLVPILKGEYSIGNYALTSLVQGQHTRRWVLGWSFDYYRASDSIGRVSENSPLRALNPPITEITIDVTDKTATLERVKIKLEAKLDELVAYGLKRESRQDNRLVYGIRVPGDIWSRSFRRSRAQRSDSEPPIKRQRQKVDDLDYRFTITVLDSTTDTPVQLHVRWNYGMEDKVFESFTGMIKRAVC